MKRKRAKAVVLAGVIGIIVAVWFNPLRVYSEEDGSEYAIENLLRKIEIFQERVSIDPDYALENNFLNIDIDTVYDSDVLLANLKKLTELKPQFYDTYFVIGKIYNRRGDRSRAETYYRLALEKNHPRSAGIRQLAAQMEREGGVQFDITIYLMILVFLSLLGITVYIIYKMKKARITTES